uniref:Uncharacterized protein n=1 Tax=Romanomermis culicivorax TaxID=13658 RepID=A0A915KN41_ROMCU
MMANYQKRAKNDYGLPQENKLFNITEAHQKKDVGVTIFERTTISNSISNVGHAFNASAERSELLAGRSVKKTKACKNDPRVAYCMVMRASAAMTENPDMKF